MKVTRVGRDKVPGPAGGLHPVTGKPAGAGCAVSGAVRPHLPWERSMFVEDFGIVARLSIPHAEFGGTVAPVMPVSYG